MPSPEGTAENRQLSRPFGKVAVAAVAVKRYGTIMGKGGRRWFVAELQRQMSIIKTLLPSPHFISRTMDEDEKRQAGPLSAGRPLDWTLKLPGCNCPK